MDAFTPTAIPPQPPEHLTGAVERVTFHSEETGFCVLRVKVRGHRDLVTMVGTAATITPGEYVEGEGWWVTDRSHGLQFKTTHLRVVPPVPWRASKSIWAQAWSKASAPTLPRNWSRRFRTRSLPSLSGHPNG